MKLRIINKSEYSLPEYKTEGAAGMDVCANVKKPKIIESLERVLIPTGLYPEIPKGYEMQVRPRSGLALKKGLTVLNTPGTIDSDYRGEIGIILVNLSKEPTIIEPGERIAQLVIAKYEKVEIEEVEEISESERGVGGFGSTGY